MNEMVTIPREEYEALVRAREDLADIEAFDRAKAEGGESIPAEYVNRLLDGDHQRADRQSSLREFYLYPALSVP